MTVSLLFYGTDETNESFSKLSTAEAKVDVLFSSLKTVSTLMITMGSCLLIHCGDDRILTFLGRIEYHELLRSKWAERTHALISRL